MPLDPLKYLGKLIVKALGVVVSRNVKSINFTGAGQTTTSSDDEVTVDIPGSGGGGTPAGSDQEIQINTSGAFDSDSDFKWDKNNNRLLLGENTDIVLGDGKGLSMVMGDSDTGDAGSWTIEGGTSSGNNDNTGGLGATVFGDGGEANGNGGDWESFAGEARGDGNGGDYTSRAGAGHGEGNGGDYHAEAGDAGDTDARGGDFFIKAGLGSGTGQDGSIILEASRVPTSASDVGEPGAVAWDSDYFYVCIDTDTWKRTALSTW